MISIDRSECPKLLTEKKEKWDVQVAAGKNAHCMKHGTEITETLKCDARIKCMYCEGRSSDYEIEHIKPFSKYKCLAHEWTNLGWVCPPCNKKKLNLEGFIDPYKDDPREKIGFENHVAFVRGEVSLTAEKTVNRILNNEGLQIRRKMALENFVKLYSVSNQETKLVLQRYKRSSAEFSAMYTDYLDSVS